MAAYCNETLVSADHNGQVYGRLIDLTSDLSFYARARMES
jgi:hypothetical protein